MPTEIELKFPDIVKWRPKDDITAYELALALPLVIAAITSTASIDNQIKFLPADVRRHFEVIQNPYNR